jgi:hypothetical protein
MRRRRSNWVVALAGAIALNLGTGSVARAQSGLAQEGALFLLLPVGARSVGMGQAVVADRGGTESVWWNPAGIGASTKREAAIHHSQSVAGTGDAVTILVPSSLLGVLALSVNIFDYGEQQTNPGDPTGSDGGGSGTIIPRSFIYAATYATSLGTYVTAGLTYKLIQFRIDCTGICPDINFSATTSALDLGAQFVVKKSVPLVIGVAARNLVGLKLQVNDSPQSDPIPRRLQVGVQYRLDIPPRLAPETAVRLAFDLADGIHVGNPAPRFGTDIAYRDRFHVRAGYAFEASRSDAGGPSIGIGINTGNLVFDVGRILSGLSADAGKAPTFLSLRYLF